MKPRVAFIAPYLPAPENTGGRIRMARLARALSDECSVSLFACGGAEEFTRERAAQGGPLSVYDSLHVRGRRPSLRAFGSAPERVKSATPIALAWDLWRAHRARPFSVAVVSHSYAMALADVLRGVRVVLDEHNVESAYAQATADARGAQGTAVDRERERLSQWERGCWARARAVTCVSEADAAAVRSAGANDVRVIANGVALDGVRYRPASERRASGAKDVLFVGLMSHGPNEEGAEFLAREVMPLVWERVADARLVLCGRQPSAKVIALTSPRVEVTGTVASVAPFLDRARVIAVPLGHGAGSSLKAVEALASGATVVSTAVGMRGIEGARAGLTHREAERAEDFADAIVRSFTDVGPADDGASARARAVAERYDWTRIGEDFLKVVREASA